MAKKSSAKSAPQPSPAGGQDLLVVLSRAFAWSCVSLMCVFLLNNYLNHWQGWPGVESLFDGRFEDGSALTIVQALFYVGGFAAAVGFVMSTKSRALRPDSEILYSATAFLIRACFWAVFLIGLSDAVVSFLRVEGFLPALFGDKLAIDLGRTEFRGLYVHFPMLALGFVIAVFHRGLAFPWLALLVVVAELLIVITRFIFSYEQAFMADLVRFWYAALFLFASAYTLLEEGHVRVDVLYSGFRDRTKGLVNAFGSVLLGLSLCGVIIYYGMSGKSSVINGPLLVFEATQTGFGMYVKYWMAGFLAIFGVSMMIQFSGYFLEGIADYRGDPDKRKMDTELGTVH
jgi:TRAP-type mannitol/chloroaromatic compound transport system permease small subunit